MQFSLPEGLTRLSQTDDGAAWLSRVPQLVERARDRWSLDVGPPFSAGSASWTALARPSGEIDWSLVLKIAYPHREAAAEADGLLHWHGHGAPRLVDVEPQDWALLMAAVRPGTAMAAGLWPAAQALRAGARVLAQLHAVPIVEPHPFENLAQTVAWWRDLVARRSVEQTWAPVDHELVSTWHEVLDQLMGAPSRKVLLHGDANPGNLLAAEDGHRVQWFAIDPKPVVGDPAFDPWPLLEQVDPNPFESADPAGELLERTALVAGVIDVPAWRVAGWSLVRRVESALWIGSITPERERVAARRGLGIEWDWARIWHGVYRRARRISDTGRSPAPAPRQTARFGVCQRATPVIADCSRAFPPRAWECGVH